MKSVISLQKMIGATSDGVFGRETIFKSMDYYKLSESRAAHFFGQCMHESGSFKVMEENLNYSKEGLLKTFNNHYKFMGEQKLSEHERNPEKIANFVYANRMGNGNAESGDGYKYRGRGAIQTTGRSNYAALAKYLNDPEIMEKPELVSSKYAFDSAYFFFVMNGIFSLCDMVTDERIKAVSKKINGGTNGLDDRIQKTYYCYKLIKDGNV